VLGDLSGENGWAAERSRFRTTPPGKKNVDGSRMLLFRIVPVGHEVAHALAARKPVGIETGNGEHIRHVNLAHELAGPYQSACAAVADVPD